MTFLLAEWLEVVDAWQLDIYCMSPAPARDHLLVTSVQPTSEFLDDCGGPAALSSRGDSGTHALCSSRLHPEVMPHHALDSFEGGLSVRREGVTEAAGKLQDAGLIHYSRGRITIIDRLKLEERVCECS